jgi:tetratricopeptide (TPR) repeat protein
MKTTRQSLIMIGMRPRHAKALSMPVAFWVLAMVAAGAAQGREIEPNTWMVTVNKKTPVKSGSNTLFVLAEGSELAARQTNGAWVGVTVMQGKKQIRGWVPKKNVALVEHPSEIQRQFSGALATIPADKRYIAFSLNAARTRIAPTTGVVSWLVGLASGDARPDNPEVAYLGGITCVRGLVVDPETGDAIVVGQYIPGRERLTLDDLVVALRARFVHGQWPVVSIDPPPQPTTPPLHNVRFEGGVADTAFGYALYDADYLLKQLGLGKVPMGVKSVRSSWDLWLEESRQQNRQSLEVSSRVWFFPIIAATPARNNVAAYKGLKVGVFSEVLAAKIDGQSVRDLAQLKQHAHEKHVAMVRQHFDELAAMHPPFRRIEQLNELVALSRAIEVMQQRPDLSWWLEKYAVHPVDTPKTAKELSRSQEVPTADGSYTRTVTSRGGVELRAMALRLEAGDVSALADAALTARPSADALAWAFIVDDWVIAIPPELDVTKGAEVTPQLVYAQFLIRQGHYKEALVRLDQVLAKEPNYVDALYFKGVVLSDSLQRHDEAIVCFDQVLVKLPESTDALIGRGLAFAKKDNYSTAEEDFDKAVQSNPRLANAMAYRGLCRGNLGEPEKAIADFDEALRLDPAMAIAYVWRGNIRLAQSEAEGALADFNEAIRRDASLAPAYAARGKYYYDRQELDKALADYNEAIRLDSSDLSYRFIRAIIHSDKHELPQAIADYSEILKREPQQTEIRWKRSEAYRNNRQFQKALEDCKELSLLLYVEVATESAPLKAKNETVGHAAQGDEVQVTKVNGSWLAVEVTLSDGQTVRGWINQKHVR